MCVSLSLSNSVHIGLPAISNPRISQSESTWTFRSRFAEKRVYAGSRNFVKCCLSPNSALLRCGTSESPFQRSTISKELTI